MCGWEGCSRGVLNDIAVSHESRYSARSIPVAGPACQKGRLPLVVFQTVVCARYTTSHHRHFLSRGHARLHDVGVSSPSAVMHAGPELFDCRDRLPAACDVIAANLAQARRAHERIEHVGCAKVPKEPRELGDEGKAGVCCESFAKTKKVQTGR